jgi:hypothetical protein
LLFSDFPDDHLQSLEVDRFGEMLEEARVAGFGDVLFHAKAGEGDGGNAEVFALTELLDQIDAGAVGQAEIAEQ